MFRKGSVLWNTMWRILPGTGRRSSENKSSFFRKDGEKNLRLLLLTESLLIGRYGKDTIRVPLEKIENFAVYRNLLGNIFKFGTVTIGTPSITIRIPYISDPEIFRDKVLELRDKRLSWIKKEHTDTVLPCAPFVINKFTVLPDAFSGYSDNYA